MKELRTNGKFDSEKPGRHINNWDFKRLEKFGNMIGFKKIYKSRYQGSGSPTLQGYDMDKTHPQMSLYVDFIK